LQAYGNSQYLLESQFAFLDAKSFAETKFAHVSVPFRLSDEALLLDSAACRQVLYPLMSAPPKPQNRGNRAYSSERRKPGPVVNKESARWH